MGRAMQRIRVTIEYEVIEAEAADLLREEEASIRQHLACCPYRKLRVKAQRIKPQRRQKA